MKSTRPRPIDEFDFNVFSFVVFSVIVLSVLANVVDRPDTRCPDSTKGTMFGCAKVVDGVVVYVGQIDSRTYEDRLIGQANASRFQVYVLYSLGVGVVWVCVRRWVSTQL